MTKLEQTLADAGFPHVSSVLSIRLLDAAKLDNGDFYRRGVEDGKAQSPAPPAIPEDVRETARLFMPNGCGRTNCESETRGELLAEAKTRRVNEAANYINQVFPKLG